MSRQLEARLEANNQVTIVFSFAFDWLREFVSFLDQLQNKL